MGARYISGIASLNSRINAAYHLLDRACVGHCFSWGNCEPSTAQFRVRASQNNTVVVWNHYDAVAMEFGIYRVPDLGFSLNYIEWHEDAGGEACVRRLQPGEAIVGPWAQAVGSSR